MTPAQVKYAAVKYLARLQGAGAVPVSTSLSDPRPSPQAQMDHAAWMCVEMERMHATGSMETQHGIEKAMRWLGFVQGVLWASGVYSIEDMKDDNRSAKLKSVPPAGG